MKVYAVKKGKTTGIFESWAECQAATAGYSGAEFKSFVTKEEAEAYLQDKDIWAERIAQDNADGFAVAFTDGSYDDQYKRYAYGVLLIAPDGTRAEVCGYGDNPKFIESKNIIGEIFGVINALDWAVSNGYERIRIYHDYEGLPKWISGEWEAKTNSSKMFLSLFTSKYDGLITAEFIKVPGHSNIEMNDTADRLAKSALVSCKKEPIKGENWYSVPNFKKQDFDALIELMQEADPNIHFTYTDVGTKHVYRFTYGKDNVTVSLFKSGNKKLLVQGKNTFLFQVIAAYIIEVEEGSSVEQLLGSAYRLSIKKDEINEAFSLIEASLKPDCPEGIKRLIRQSLVNLKYYVYAEDYSQYAFPALRALEGHIKYLIQSTGRIVGRSFDCFNKDTATNMYFYTPPIADSVKKLAIETCYNYYKSQRDTTFHFGDILGAADSTRAMTKKEDADEIIKECLRLISNYQ